MNRIKNFFLKHGTIILLIIATITVYGVVYQQRMADYNFWMLNSQEYVVDHVTAMTSMDAYYWIKMAKELDAGQLGKGKRDSLRGYPDHALFAIGDQPSLLAELISYGKTFTGGDYYRSGLLLIPLLAGLFVFPLFYYFSRIGFGASAVLGGLIGAFSRSYYDRTAMGRVDTDLLNTFFPLAIACFILPMNKERNQRGNLLLAAGAGFSMYLYNWWYQQPSLILVYLFLLTLYLLLGRVNWKQIGLILAVFLLASGPAYVLQSLHSLHIFLAAYVSPPPTGRIAWPNILATVGEAQTMTVMAKLKLLHGLLPLVFAGFSGLAFLCIRRFRQVIPLAPLFVLGLWGLEGPNRFTMYLAPLVGIGVGVLIEAPLKYAGKKLGLKPFLAVLVAIPLMATLFFATDAETGYPYFTAPAISAATTRSILDVKQIVPRHSAMFTPFWEYGYALMDLGDFATYQDGGLQSGIRTTLSAKAVTSSNQRDMVSFLSYLEDHGFDQLGSRIRKQKMSSTQMMKLVFDYPGPFRGKNVYVIYLKPMIKKFGSISYMGTWDFEKKKDNSMEYYLLDCSTPVNNKMSCSDGYIDLNRGMMNDGTGDIPLHSAIFVNNGYTVARVDYKNGPNADYYLEVLMRNNQIVNTLVADERLYPTNFNQQYILGNYDRRYFKEVYNNFPVARVLKVKSAEAGNSAP